MKQEIFGNITLYNCDCMEYMATCKDNEFDLAIVDPPYGFMKSNNLNFRYKKQYNNIAPKEEYWLQLYRISKNQIIWGANYFVNYLKPTKSWLCWDKNNPVENFSDCELAYTSFDTLTIRIKLDSYGFRHADKRSKNGSTIHPTQKPVILYQWLLNKFAKPGQKIFDSHFGSLSIGIACHNLGFELTACELDKEYYEAAKKRLQIHQMQQRLF